MNITINISELDEKILKNDLENIEDWVRSAVAGKIAGCRSRLVDTWMPVLLDSPDIRTLPATQDGLVGAIFSHPDYKNRNARETADNLGS
jgi:hypothetical protein|tara:strand:- start:133 stop:402 length:270 start_codon:yes stop_codon:yes gene_type:complete